MRQPIRSTKDLALLSIEEIVKLPYFYSLKKMERGKDDYTPHWEITFHYTKMLAEGSYEFFEIPLNKPFIKLYRIIG